MASMRGYVTTLESVLGKTDYELEQSLGFGLGSFKPGFRLYALADQVFEKEFVWRDKTRYSAGWHADPSIKFGSDPNAIWSVQRQDELRAALGKQLNYDEKKVDAVLAERAEKSLSKLNIRSGPEMIVKIVPLVKPTSYPDAPSGNIPQWELLVAKEFKLMGEFQNTLPRQFRGVQR